MAYPNLYGPAMEPEQHPVPEPKWPSAAASVFVWAKDQLTPAAEAPPEAPSPRELRAVERELATALAEITSLNELLEDIPEIFERKFQQRLLPLLAENQALRHQVLQLQSSSTGFRAAELLPPVRPSRGQRPRFGQVIRHAFGLNNAA
jgi:hypothetical protein